LSQITGCSRYLLKFNNDNCNEELIANISNVDIENANNNSMLITARSGILLSETKNENITLVIGNLETQSSMSLENKNIYERFCSLVFIKRIIVVTILLLSTIALLIIVINIL
jgi:hypothetical protein